MSESLGVGTVVAQNDWTVKLPPLVTGARFTMYKSRVTERGRCNVSKAKAPRPIVKARRTSPPTACSISSSITGRAAGSRSRRFSGRATEEHGRRGITGVCVLPVVGDSVALVDYYRHPLAQMSLEAPKGFMDAGETPEQAALRELAEETGLSCAAAD